MCNSSPFFILIVIFLGCCFSNCSDPVKEDKVDLAQIIQGHWILKKAYRNKKQTVALENTFFEFHEDGNMKTNFNVDMKTENHPFLVRKNIIRRQTPDSLTYHIYEASDTSLTLQTRYKGYEFKLIMERQDLENGNK